MSKYKSADAVFIFLAVTLYGCAGSNDNNKYLSFPPTRPGYNFLGWYKDEGLSIPATETVTEENYSDYFPLFAFDQSTAEEEIELTDKLYLSSQSALASVYKNNIISEYLWPYINELTYTANYKISVNGTAWTPIQVISGAPPAGTYSVSCYTPDNYKFSSADFDKDNEFYTGIAFADFKRKVTFTLVVAKPHTDNGFIYLIDKDEAIIIGYEGNEQEVSVPEKLGGKTVTVIQENLGYQGGKSLFRNSVVKKIILSENIRRIETWYQNSSTCLEEMIFNHKLQQIWMDSLKGMTGKISLPKSVYFIGAVRDYNYSGVGGLVDKNLFDIEISPQNPNYKITDGFLLSKDGKTLYWDTCSDKHYNNSYNGLTGETNGYDIWVTPRGVEYIRSTAFTLFNYRQSPFVLLPESLKCIDEKFKMMYGKFNIAINKDDLPENWEQFLDFIAEPDNLSNIKANYPWFKWWYNCQSGLVVENGIVTAEFAI